METKKTQAQTCSNCQKRIRGRKDKKYCSPYCRHRAAYLRRITRGEIKLKLNLKPVFLEEKEWEQIKNKPLIKLMKHDDFPPNRG